MLQVYTRARATEELHSFLSQSELSNVFVCIIMLIKMPRNAFPKALCMQVSGRMNIIMVLVLFFFFFVLCCMEKEDHDIKFDSQKVPDIDLLNCTKEDDQKYDSEDDIELDALFSTEQPIQKCDYNTCASSISSFTENDQKDSESESDSNFEVEHSEEEERDHSADEFADDEEENSPFAKRRS